MHHVISCNIMSHFYVTKYYVIIAWKVSQITCLPLSEQSEALLSPAATVHCLHLPPKRCILHNRSVKVYK